MHRAILIRKNKGKGNHSDAFRKDEERNKYLG